MTTHALSTERTTRAEALCETLEAMIVDGRLSPGDKLDETELAQQFDVSRTPVREAIRALVAIGLVDASGRQGATVAQVSVSMLIEMFELMAVLEGMCAKLAARRATDDDRAKMHETHKVLETAYKERDPDKFYHVNIDFHDQLYAAAQTQFLAGQTLRLRRRLSPYRMRVTYQPGRMLASLDEHAAIIAAIDDRDSDRAMLAAQSHVRLMGDQLEDFIASLPEQLKA
ncbi:MAG: GntR family transcriptional regulator [Pseudomonadota bacterium]